MSFSNVFARRPGPVLRLVTETSSTILSPYNPEENAGVKTTSIEVKHPVLCAPKKWVAPKVHPDIPKQDEAKDGSASRSTLTSFFAKKVGPAPIPPSATHGAAPPSKTSAASRKRNVKSRKPSSKRFKSAEEEDDDDKGIDIGFSDEDDESDEDDVADIADFIVADDAPLT